MCLPSVPATLDNRLLEPRQPRSGIIVIRIASGKKWPEEDLRSICLRHGGRRELGSPSAERRGAHN